MLSRQLDDLEPTLTRHGYRIKDLVEQFDARPTEIKALFSGSVRSEPLNCVTKCWTQGCRFDSGRRPVSCS
ncbi:hypothetical protein ALO68_200084 [Pseudomonas syringae pv. helianthi]|uniref:Resolvase n=1 Tax=Pseudomonas syringae pv. helianthi TaxID=251654 RepID=A0A0P9RVX4_9PSED|nr:hypothetical protein ALO68_200084 [Pseudomonas syringae pv. helianthi]